MTRTQTFLYYWATEGLKSALKRTTKFFLKVLKGQHVPAPVNAATSASEPTGKAAPNMYKAPFPLIDISDAKMLDNLQTYGRETKPAKGTPVVWYIPNWLYWWGGGHLTLLRFAHLIEKRGINTVIFVYDNHGWPTVEKLRADLDEACPGHTIKLETDIKKLPVGHVAIASSWQSVFSALEAPTPSERFYFMQEYESLLYPGGTQAEQANASYKMGFKGITGGGWLRSIFESYGGTAINYNFTVDKTIFYGKPEVRDQVTRLFFYGRPSTDRRMYDLGVAVLEQIHKRWPEVEIIIAGLDGLSTLPFPVTYLGNMEVSKTGDLYRTVDIGLTFSGSNMSYLPVELMACGVPVLSNNGAHVEWFCTHKENAYLCYPFVADFVRGFEELYNSKELRQKLVVNGLEKIKESDWDKEAQKIHDHIVKELGWA